MWNYSFTVPSLLILAVIVSYYFLLPRLPIRLNYSFLMLLGADAMTIFFDVLGSKVLEIYTPELLIPAYLLNLGFFAAFLARIFLFFRMTVDAVETRCPLPQSFHKWTLCPLVAAEAIAISSPLTKAVFYIDAQGYHKGPLYNVLYVCFFLYLLLSLVLTLQHRKKLPRGSRLSLLGYVFVLAAGNVVRMLLPQFLVMNTFCLVAILILYLSFENPDLYLSDRGGAFNGRAFQTLIGEWNRWKEYRVLGFALRGYTESRGLYGAETMDECVRQISLFLAKLEPGVLAFYLRNGCFALVGTDRADLAGLQRRIEERFRESWHTGEAVVELRADFLEVRGELRGYSGNGALSMLLLALENAGKGQTSFLSVDAVNEYLEHKRSLELALENDGVELFLQPIVASGTGALAGAEALARIRDGHGNLIYPDDFIPLAEKDGSIERLGEQMLRKTCAFLRDHGGAALGLGWINVNLSPRQCMREELPLRFSAILREYGVDPSLIHLELTEASIIDYALLEKQISALRAFGFCFSLDDYGSGYSNLARVRRLSFETVKLDKEVVWDHFRHPDLMLPSLIQVFRQMRLGVTAEGVETAEMAERLREIGCDYLQGYYFSRPLPPAEFLKKYSGASPQGL